LHLNKIKKYKNKIKIKNALPKKYLHIRLACNQDIFSSSYFRLINSVSVYVFFFFFSGRMKFVHFCLYLSLSQIPLFVASTFFIIFFISLTHIWLNNKKLSCFVFININKKEMTNLCDKFLFHSDKNELPPPPLLHTVLDQL
jgi:hypothetical protein